MMRYVYQTTITVEVLMADDGETGTEGYETDIAKWDSPDEQQKSAREWAEQAMPMQDYAEPWVKVDAPELKLIRTEPAAEEVKP